MTTRLAVSIEARVGCNAASAFSTVSLDKTPPTLTITEPASNAAIRRLPNLTVKGTAIDDNLVNVLLNGVDVGFALSFEQVVPLAEGQNTFTAVANDVAGNATTRTITTTFVKPPVVRITSPTDLAAVGTTPITFTGTVSDPGGVVKVGVLQIPATVTGNSWTVSVHLSEGGNVVTAVVTDANGNAGTDSITVALDTQSPRVIIDSPAAGSVVTSPTITVTGRVNDLVLGTINSSQATVRVNGIPATVSNRTFRAVGVTLQPGLNTIVASALDATGNQDSKTSTVMYDNLPGSRLEAVSGDQAGNINEPLPNPLVVRVIDASGAPLPNRDVIFRVASNSGSLLPPATAGALDTPKRGIIVKTDAAGEVRAFLTLGSRAGEGNNRIEVSSPGVAGGATFSISGHPKIPALISVDAGGLQRGVPSQPLPRPFVVVVTDEGHNRLVGVPVTFKVEDGGGDFDGATEKLVTTDADGRALAILTLGPSAGIENNTVSAAVPLMEGLPAVFTATALEPGEAANTRIAGVVLDNQNDPIEGVTLRVRNTANATQTNAQGQFTLTGVPVGDVHMQVDGSTAQRPGTYPNLEFELQTVSGAVNTVGMPIFLLPLDLNQSAFVDETHGGEITIPDYPGFKLTIAPNSAMFPDGSRRGTVSVTVVHADKVPMVPNFGQQPRFIVTIQPPGVRFDPPAQIVHPNVDGLKPGAITELYSFDHDMGSFVATGTATVSEDGLVLTGDAGTGVLKGGWHCGGNPQTTGTARSCEGGERVSILYEAFIMPDALPAPISLEAECSIPIPGMNLNRNIWLRGDRRGFEGTSARGRESVRVALRRCDSASGVLGTPEKHVSESETYADDFRDHGTPNIDPEEEDELGDCHFRNARGKAPNAEAGLEVAGVRFSDGEVSVLLAGSIKFPLFLVTPTPAIDWDVVVTLTETAPHTVEYRISGRHDGFPAHQIRLNGESVYRFQPDFSSWLAPFALTGFLNEQTVDCHGTIVNDRPTQCK